jgi:hypothetical protein
MSNNLNIAPLLIKDNVTLCMSEATLDELLFCLVLKNRKTKPRI